MNFISRLSFITTATTAGTAVAVGTAAIAAVLAVKRTVATPMSFLGSSEMNLQSSLSIVLGMARLCSSTGSRPDAGRGFSFSSPSFFCGYQSRACFYIL